MSAPEFDDYRPLTTATAIRYLAGIDSVVAVLGNDHDSWSISEIGDGNLNLVFRIESATGSIIAKQALPYIRARGENFPLPLSRASFEFEALSRQAQHAPGATPTAIAHDSTLALTIMEYLEPHIILRKGLVMGVVYPRLAKDMGNFLARTLFYSSRFAMDDVQLNADKKLFAGNAALCDVTNARVFTEPYCDAVLNRWTSPQLDSTVQSIRADIEYKNAIAEMQSIYNSKPQALLHGDLHSGSVMATEDDTRVIDPEFAFYGPMGFDVGALLANLLIAYVSQPAHSSAANDRKDYAEWILATIETIWSTFVDEFTRLWHSARNPNASVAVTLPVLMEDILNDSLGFAAAKMTRRVIGAAHVEDLESIFDPDDRAVYERKVLGLARSLLLQRETLTTVSAVSALARNV